jgi:mono/diheme cytochrome c family protein
VAVLAVVGAVLWGRLRLLALAVLAGVLVWRSPSFALLTVEAYPTSFQTSPTGFDVASIVRGQALFGQDCVACHGADGDGHGPAAASRRIAPADLTAPHIWEHSDGEMFWWLTHGIDNPEGGMAMPGFSGLPAADRWALIDYVRAHNAGVAMLEDASFDVPVPAPGLPVRCSGVAATRMADLRGSVVHVVTGALGAGIPPQFGIKVVTLTLGDIRPAPGDCASASPEAWKAFAVLADVPPDRLEGTEFLVDANGWLRGVHRGGSPNGWHTRDDLIAAVRHICSSPLETGGDAHAHHH